MYKIVNYDWNQSDPNLFATFDSVYTYYKNNTDQQDQIYYITEQENTKVWDPAWSNINPELENNLIKVHTAIKELSNGN